jgi:hypothetical protein
MVRGWREGEQGMTVGKLIITFFDEHRKRAYERRELLLRLAEAGPVPTPCAQHHGLSAQQ